jgi:16S rRNA (adenine1518-N6/adenine1519-N6)-dimethyltransferase
MQTKQQLEQLLASAGVMPNKRLGQHFLIDLNLMRLLVEAAHIRNDDVIVEVGCGTGSLTEETATHAGKVICVELDATLVKIATRQLASRENVKIIYGDALENKNELNKDLVAELEKACEQYFGRVLLVANLPYNVAASVMLNLIIGPTIADAMFVTVQKEVADRMIALPSHEEYGTLSIFMAATGSVKIFRKLPPTVFWPRPQVDSAMVEYERDKEKVARIQNMEMLQDVVGLFMGHRRKMLRACVKFAEGKLAMVHHWDDIFTRSFVEPHHRPEELTAENYISIANLCHEALL